MQRAPQKTRNANIMLVCSILFMAIPLEFASAEGITSIGWWKEHEGMIRSFAENHEPSAAGLLIMLYAATALFMPGALLLTVAAGYFFGTIRGSIYVVTGGMFGAATGFLIARRFLHAWIHRRYGHQLRWFNAEMKRHGDKYLFALRMIPILPFFLVNYLAGVTAIPFWKYLGATFIGMVPGIGIYTYAGSKLQQLADNPKGATGKAALIIAIIGILPLVSLVIHRLWHRNR
jgi:uncharacterized membrane protein YdjX (TVP38/TMEM64 family)